MCWHSLVPRPETGNEASVGNIVLVYLAMLEDRWTA